jgi:Tol biopolymer transport system component
MPANPGETFGPYEIVGPLGAGGMGEVYRARDSRLNRDVAIKILPQNFAIDPDRRARFEREAQAIASLSHPNVLAIFDTGVHASQLFIVTELLDGETLREQIGRLPVRKAIDIGVQIARGLTAAHEKGLVHRDLKPENIFLLADGQVKILDFGLARQANAAAAAAGVMTGAPTAAGVTDPGIAVGTAGYMSPEQVRGGEVDHRTDIFAFGSVLYEMLSGRRAFQRDTAAETMTAILKEDSPELADSGVQITPQLDRIVRRCLEKQPRMRFQSAADLGFALDAATAPTGSGAAVVVPGVSLSPSSRRDFPWIALAAFAFGLILASVLFIVLHSAHAMPDPSAFRFTPFSFESGGQAAAVWSQDGKAVAYGASMDRLLPVQVFVRYLDSPTGKQLTHFKEYAVPVSWTPDGRRIVFASGHEPAGLWSVAVVGGEPESLMALNKETLLTNAVVTNDVSAAAMLRVDGDISLWISSPIGSPLKKYSPDPFATKTVLNNPTLAFSPDRKSILLFMNSGDRGREEAWLVPYPADPSHPPRLIFEDFPTWGGTPTFSWMPDSRRIVVALQTNPASAKQLFEADTVSGRRSALTSQTNSMFSPSVSPDGDRIIFSEPSGSLDIVSVSLDNATARSWMSTERNESMPAWALNQPMLVYVTDRSGPLEIWLQSPDGFSRPIVTARDFPAGTTQWLMSPILSPGADRVIYGRIGHSDIAGSSTAHMWISSVSGGVPVPVTNDMAANEMPGSWSPDGNWLVYIRLQNGKADIVKVKTSGQDVPIVLKADIHHTNSSVPIWSPVGDWIEFNDHGENLISPDGQMTRSLGDLHADGCTFSRDGRQLYCVRWDTDHETLFSTDLSGKMQNVILRLDADYRPSSSLGPAIRLSLSPDGKSIAYGHSRNANRSLWLLEGFAPKESLLQRLHLRD